MNPVVVENDKIALRKLSDGCMCKIIFDSLNGAENFSISILIT